MEQALDLEPQSLTAPPGNFSTEGRKLFPARGILGF
jgi:hypothetical protein